MKVGDRIKKFDAIIEKKDKNDFIVACALRESGNFDIYYNAFKVSSSPDKSKTIYLITFSPCLWYWVKFWHNLHENEEWLLPRGNQETGCQENEVKR